MIATPREVRFDLVERTWIVETGRVGDGWRVAWPNGWTACSDHGHRTPEAADRCYRRALRRLEKRS